MLQRGGTSGKSTNINFRGWSKQDTCKSDQRDLRGSVIKTSKLPNLTQRRSKFLARLVDDINRHPQLRPSVCTIITGIIFLLCAVVIVAVPFIRERVPTWVYASGLALSSFVVICGMILFCRQSLIVRQQIKRSRHVAVKLMPLPRLNNAVNEDTIIEEEKCNGKESTVIAPKDDNLQRQLLNKRYAYSLSKHRRKLPSSPEWRQAHSFQEDRRYLRQINCHGLLETKPNDLAFFSSEPDLHVIGARSSLLERDCRLTTKSQLAVPARTNFTRAHTLPQSGEEVRALAIRLETADQIFQIFHDPLLYTSITRLKFKCDHEF